MSNFDLKDLPNLYFNEVNILSKFEKNNCIQELTLLYLFIYSCYCPS